MPEHDVHIQHFEGTVEKITKDGERVMSSYLEDGERLASEVDAETREKNDQDLLDSDKGTSIKTTRTTSKSR